MFGNRYADITTRQDIQLHWIRIEDVPRIWQRLWDVGRHHAAGLRRLRPQRDLLPGGGRRRRRGVRRLPGRPGDLRLLHRQPRVRQPAPQVQDRRHRLPRGLRPGRDQRHRAVAGPGRRRRRSASTCWSAAASPTASGWRRTSTSSSRPTRPSRSAGPSPSSSASSATGRTGAWPACATWSRSSGPRASGPRSAERTRFDAARRPGATSPPRFRGDHVGVHPQRGDGLFYVGCSVPVGRMRGIELVELARLAEHLRGRHGPARHRPELRPDRGARGPPRRPAGRGAHPAVLAVPGALRARRHGLHRLGVLPLRRGRDQGAGGQAGPLARRPAPGRPRRAPPPVPGHPRAAPRGLRRLGAGRGPRRHPHALLGLLGQLRAAPDRRHRPAGRRRARGRAHRGGGRHRPRRLPRPRRRLHRLGGRRRAGRRAPGALSNLLGPLRARSAATASPSTRWARRIDNDELRTIMAGRRPGAAP